MGKRLTGFDYSRPMFYMVTIKCCKSVRALCEIVAPGKCQLSAITRAMVNCIRNFHLGCEAIAPIECFSIMPDHIHLLIRIVDRSTANIRLLRLETIVDLLMQALEGRYREVTGLREQVFEAGWHDWIVVAEGQLAAFTRYIRENPRRAFLREENRRYFTRVRRVNFAEREWVAYGNAALLELPVIEPFRCSRTWAKDGVEWREAMGRAERIGPGGAGCGTFMSPCEKACGNAIYQAGGSLIVLSPEGFAPRWHPPRNKEALCAKGRMLFLSLWEADAAKPDNATLYRRCHEMGDAIVQGLAQNSDGLARMVQNSDGKTLMGGAENQSFAEQEGK
jgi:REP element-mobilizing transposase RayT